MIITLGPFFIPYVALNGGAPDSSQEEDARGTTLANTSPIPHSFSSTSRSFSSSFFLLFGTMASCNGTSQLYCEPAQGDTLTEDQTTQFVYNAQFESLNGSDAVDIYLYRADNSSLAESILHVPNTGEMSFTINSTWFSLPPATTVQSYPFQWYVVARGRTFNLPSSSATYGPVFFAEQPAISSSATPTPTPTPAPQSHKSSGVSVGVIAGIAIGVLVVLSAFLIALSFFLKKNRDKVKLDSDSDIPPPTDGEKATLKTTTLRRSLSTTDTTHFDVPLTFAPGSAPGTPRSTSEFPRVPVEAVKMYVGPPRSVGQQGAMEYNVPPRSPVPEMRQQRPTGAGQAPPSPKFPIQSNGALPVGWQTTPAQRSQQQRPPARDQPQPIEGQPRPMRTEQGPPQQFRNDRPPQSYRGEGPPPSPRTDRPPQSPRSARPPQAYRSEGPPQSSRGERPPQAYRSEGPPQPPRGERPPQSYRNEGPPQSSRSERPPQAYRNNASPPQIPRKQPGSPKRIPDPFNQSQSARNPPVPVPQPRTPQDQPQPDEPVPFEAQPPSTFVRQNSRRGLIPPFPVDVVTRKPIANRTPAAPLPPPRESETDIPSDSDETPPPTKVSPITTIQVPIVRVTEVQRDQSVKSVKGTIEELTKNVSPPPSPPVTVPNVSMGTGFVGKEEPSRTPPQVIIPQVSMTPPTPQAAQFPRDVVAPVTKRPEEPSDSVTADFLRSSVTDTESGSTRTSMVVEGSSRVASTVEEEDPSRPASSVFEVEATPPLVIAKADNKKTEEVKTKEVQQSKKEESMSEEKNTENYSLPPTLPALERGSLFSFGDLT